MTCRWLLVAGRWLLVAVCLNRQKIFFVAEEFSKRALFKKCSTGFIFKIRWVSIRWEILQ